MFATYFGDPNLLNEQVERYHRVTATEVTAFAAQRLGRDNRASLLYIPREDGAETSDIAALAGTGA
jgi:hypothetical protein